MFHHCFQLPISFPFKFLLFRIIFTAPWHEALVQSMRGLSECSGPRFRLRISSSSNITGTKWGLKGILFKSKNMKITAKHPDQYFISINLSFWPVYFGPEYFWLNQLLLPPHSLRLSVLSRANFPPVSLQAQSPGSGTKRRDNNE